MTETLASHGMPGLTGVHFTLFNLKGLRALAMAAFLGALMALGFAPFHFSLALVIAFTGLIWLLDGAKQQRRWGRAFFARAWAFSFGFFLISMHWTAFPFLVEPEKNAHLLWMPLILLPGGMAVIWGLAGALAGGFWSASPSRIYIFAVFFGGAEFVRSVLFGGFPWNLAATTWAPGQPISQLAALGGVHWLTLLTIALLAAPAALVDTRPVRGYILRCSPTILTLAALTCAYVWGAQRLSHPAVLTERTVSLMDAGVPQTDKFNDQGQTILARYAEFLQTLPKEAGDIVVWPEGVLPDGLFQTTGALDIVAALLEKRTLITGTLRIAAGDQGQLQYYNSLAVLTANQGDAELVAFYDKQRLVPFGELSATRIIPFGKYFSSILPPTLQRMAEAGFEPGRSPAVLYPPDVPAFVSLICYEGLFPELIRHASSRLGRPQWIVLISNDAWFGEGMGPAQHYAQNRYRSIETGLPMARVASRGHTAMIDAYGRETAHGAAYPGDTAGWRASVVRTALPAPLPPTLYMRFGESFFWVTMILQSLLAFLFWRR